MSWVATERISFEGAEHLREVAFIGFPRSRIRDFRPAFGQVVLAPSLFHTELRGTPPHEHEEPFLDERFDCFGAVPETVDDRPGADPEVFAEDLQGVSGAGVFLLPMAGGASDWSPRNAQLLGLQRGVLKPSRRFVFHNAIVIRAALDAYLRGRPNDWPT